MKEETIKLSRKTAVGLIRSVVPVSPTAIESGDQGTGAVIYTAQTGALDITCSNDWYAHNGRIQLTIADRMGLGHITMYFHPDTLERDFSAEQEEQQEERREARKRWVERVGREQAHSLVDQYWGFG